MSSKIINNCHSRYTPAIIEMVAVNGSGTNTTIQVAKKTLKKMIKLQAHYSGSLEKYVTHDEFLQHLLILYEDNNELGESKER